MANMFDKKTERVAPLSAKDLIQTEEQHIEKNETVSEPKSKKEKSSKKVMYTTAFDPEFLQEFKDFVDLQYNIKHHHKTYTSFIEEAIRRYMKALNA